MTRMNTNGKVMQNEGRKAHAEAQRRRDAERPFSFLASLRLCVRPFSFSIRVHSSHSLAPAFVDQRARCIKRLTTHPSLLHLLQQCRDRFTDLRLGFHNHDGELRVLDDGQTLLDRLLELDDDLLFLELDLGWAWYAEVDPAGLVARVAPRAPLVHVKDMIRGRKPGFVPVGDGEVGYAHVLPAIRDLGVEWLLVEQDEAEGAALDAVRRSYAAVSDAVGSTA